ncbi:MAG: hypothetical protein JXR78_09260 [Victivallales bacterium]|nr:hypothetical protein [Victivallales bacterium]
MDFLDFLLRPSDIDLLAELKGWYILAQRADALPSPLMLVAVPVLIWIYFASAFLSASIAEKRGRNRLFHFIGGMMLPALYPALITQLSHSGAEEVEERKDLELERRKRSATELTRKFREVAGINNDTETVEDEEIQDNCELVEEMEIPAGTPGAQYDHLFFAAIATNDDGTPAGPFLIDFDDGRQVIAQKIIDAGEEILILEILTPAGAVRTLRVNYDKISGCMAKI